MNKSIILWRHIVGVAIVLAIHSCVVSVRSVESVRYFVGYWAGSIVIAFGIAGAISGLGYLFFTSYLKGKGVRTFIICVWVIAGFLLFGRWMLPGWVEQIKTSDSRSVDLDDFFKSRDSHDCNIKADDKFFYECLARRGKGMP